MLTVVCPGQGAQKPGMLAQWCELDGVTDLLEEWSKSAQIDLIRHGTVSDAETIRDTAIAQPLIVASSLLSWQVLSATLSEQYETEIVNQSLIVAGHSVGEFAAAAIAGVLEPAAAIALVAERGRLMAECAAITPTGMAAVVGGNADEVFAAIEQAGLTPANLNSRGQIVAAGAQDALAALAANPPARTRVVPLEVAGAFHTAYMDQARVSLARKAAEIKAFNPFALLLSNRDGAVVASGQDYLDRLVSQVTTPVHWTDCMATMADLGATGVLELTPSGVLLGLVKRDLRAVARQGIDSPADLPAAAAFVAEHQPVFHTSADSAGEPASSAPAADAAKATSA